MRRNKMKQKRTMKKTTCLALIFTILTSTAALAAEPISKEETVFVTMNESGKVESEIVSAWLQPGSNKKIVDKSILVDVKNVKGDEQPIAKDGELVWKNVEGDIYYQGKTNKALPLDVKITYFLNGKEMNPKELVGQSGDITIQLALINLDKHEVEIKGETQTICTPFASLAIINLPQDKFTNVQAENAHVLSDGNNQVITYLSFPGLEDSMQVNQFLDDLDMDLDMNLEDTLTITAHVENFEMGSIYIAATPQVLESEDVEETTKLDDLRDDLDELKDASQEITDGTVDLADGQKEFYEGMQKFYDGVNELHDKMPELEDGINQIADGAEHAKAGADELNKGGQQLAKSVPEFSAGAKAYAEGAQNFANGATQLISGLTAAQAGAQAINAGVNGSGGLVEQMNTMAGGAGQLAVGSGAVADGLTNIKDVLSSIDTTNLSDADKAKLAGCIDGLQKEDGLINSTKAIQAGNANMQSNLNANLAADGAVTQLAAGANALATGLNDATLTAGLNALNAGATQLSTNAPKLVAGANQLGTGLNALAKGIEDLDTGMAKLVKEGTRKLKSKTPDLVNGVNDLQSATVELYNGSKKLYDGSMDLNEGMTKFNRDGIIKLTDEVDGKLDCFQDVLDRKDVMVELSENYGTFTGLSDGMDGSVKFVIKTNELKAEEKEETMTTNEREEEGTPPSSNKGFINWVKNLFHHSSKAISVE